MNARLQGSKIKRIRVENAMTPEPAAGGAADLAGVKKPNHSKNEPFRSVMDHIVIRKSMY
jgi:hypothetical protein